MLTKDNVIYDRRHAHYFRITSNILNIFLL